MTLRRWLPLIVIALGAALGFVLLRDRVGFDVLRDNQLALLAYRADHPVLMPVLFVGAYALFVAFSLPGAIWFTLAGGFLFGVIPGVLYNVGAATIGAGSSAGRSPSSPMTASAERWALIRCFSASF